MAIKYIQGLKKENIAGEDEYFFPGELAYIKRKYGRGCDYDGGHFGRIKSVTDNVIVLDESREFESRLVNIYINEIDTIDHVWTTEKINHDS